MLSRYLLAAIAAFTLAGCAFSPSVAWDDTFRVYAPMTECVPIGPKPSAPRDTEAKWEKSNDPEQKIVCWEAVPKPESPAARQEIVSRCAANNFWNGYACVKWMSASGTCWVISLLTLQQAKNTPVYTSTGFGGVSVYEHEEDHCHGWVHPAGDPNIVRSVLPRRR